MAVKKFILCADPDQDNRKTLGDYVQSTIGDRDHVLYARRKDLAEGLLGGVIGDEILGIIANMRLAAEQDGLELVQSAVDQGVPHGAVLISDESLRAQVPDDITAINMGRPDELITFLRRAFGRESVVQTGSESGAA